MGGVSEIEIKEYEPTGASFVFFYLVFIFVLALGMCYCKMLP